MHVAHIICLLYMLHWRCVRDCAWQPVASEAAGGGTVVLHISHTHTKLLCDEVKST